MKYIKVFNTDVDYTDSLYEVGVELPNVSHCIEENHVHYSSNIESFKIFKEVFCDNINETDREMFRNNIVYAGTQVWKGNLGYGEPETCNVQIKFAAGMWSGEHVLQPQSYCSSPSPIVITEEQYNEWKNLSDDKLLPILLPMFRCQGEAEHTWNTPSMPS